MSGAVIIFIKNAISGHVKTRLAADIGDDAALKVYKALLGHTRHQVLKVPVDRFLFYSQKINRSDDWDEKDFIKGVQSEGDLGERMKSAFEQVLTKHQKVVIIGSDCPGLSGQHIRNAMNALEDYDVVIGPSLDGGYYLLGLKVAHESLFRDIPWSTEHVLDETMERCQSLSLTVRQLEPLTDVDHGADLAGFEWLLN